MKFLMMLPLPYVSSLYAFYLIYVETYFEMILNITFGSQNSDIFREMPKLRDQ